MWFCIKFINKTGISWWRTTTNRNAQNWLWGHGNGGHISVPLISVEGVFKDKSKDFTPWLAQEENLELLGETLGLDIELEDTEMWLTSFVSSI